MNKSNQITLKLFNAVLAKDNGGQLTFDTKYGVLIPAEAEWAKSDIMSHLKALKLSGEDLNKTFHKSWAKVQNSTRLELATEQILHYFSTYGSNFEAETYLPDEVLDVPDSKLNVFTIRALSEADFTEQALDLLRSGLALKEETLDDVFTLLDELGYSFTGKEGVKNKEANVILATRFGIYPNSAEEFLRFVVYTCTQSTSLVKDDMNKEAIEASKKDVSKHLNSFGLKKLAPIFNRFRPLFLALRKANQANVKAVNAISRLSKTLHKPMVQNPLNSVTQSKLESEDLHWLDNATVYALFKALSACYTRMEGQSSFVYRVRNGKSWAKNSNTNLEVCSHNYNVVMAHLKTRITGNKTVLIPEDVVYALPTSEKLFVGNVPTGTKFLGEKLAAGYYWENSWGARDLDLSGLNIAGKIGWNSDYYQDDHALTHSGDITNAPNGAVEYLHAGSGVAEDPTLVMSNVYAGDTDAGYKIVIGKGSKVSRNFMMNPNKVMAEIRTNSVQKNTVLGLFTKESDTLNAFTLLNFGAGNARVSGHSEVSKIATKALYEQWNKPLTLAQILEELGYNVVTEKPEEGDLDFDLSVDKLTKTTFVELFK